LPCLDQFGFANAAAFDRALAMAAEKHLFSQKMATGELNDYAAAVPGGLWVVPSDAGLPYNSLT
jgi:hypothetical protein